MLPSRKMKADHTLWRASAQGVAGRVPNRIVAGSFVRDAPKSFNQLRSMFMFPSKSSSPLAPFRLRRRIGRHPLAGADRRRKAARGGPVLSSPSRGWRWRRLGWRIAECPMPHLNRQLAHAGDRGDLLVLRIASDQAIVCRLRRVIGSHSRPRCLAENLAHACRSMPRDMALTIVGLAAFVRSARAFLACCFNSAIIFTRASGVLRRFRVSGASRPTAVLSNIVLSCKSQPIMITLHMASFSCGKVPGNVRITI